MSKASATMAQGALVRPYVHGRPEAPTNRQVRAAQNAAALGGMRTPHVSVARSSERMAFVGRQLAEALGSVVDNNGAFLAAVIAMRENRLAAMAPELIAEARDAIGAVPKQICVSCSPPSPPPPHSPPHHYAR